MKSRRSGFGDSSDRSLRLALKGLVAGRRPPREIRAAVLREAANRRSVRREQPSLSMWLRNLGVIGGEPRSAPARPVSLEPFATSLEVLALRR